MSKRNDWLKNFQCDKDDPHYTHTSMLEGQGRTTYSGKFKHPDTEEDQRRLFEIISSEYHDWNASCLVEMCTTYRLVGWPRIEQIT